MQAGPSAGPLEGARPPERERKGLQWPTAHSALRVPAALANGYAPLGRHVPHGTQVCAARGGQASQAPRRRLSPFLSARPHSLSLSTHSHNQGPPRTTFALPFTPSWPLMRLNSVVNEQQPFPFIPHSPLSRSLRRPLLTNSNTSNLSLC